MHDNTREQKTTNFMKKIAISVYRKTFLEEGNFIHASVKSFETTILSYYY